MCHPTLEFSKNLLRTFKKKKKPSAPSICCFDLVLEAEKLAQTFFSVITLAPASLVLFLGLSCAANSMFRMFDFKLLNISSWKIGYHVISSWPLQIGGKSKVELIYWRKHSRMVPFDTTSRLLDSSKKKVQMKLQQSSVFSSGFRCWENAPLEAPFLQLLCGVSSWFLQVFDLGLANLFESKIHKWSENLKLQAAMSSFVGKRQVKYLRMQHLSKKLDVWIDFWALISHCPPLSMKIARQGPRAAENANVLWKCRVGFCTPSSAILAEKWWGRGGYPKIHPMRLYIRVIIYNHTQSNMTRYGVDRNVMVNSCKLWLYMERCKPLESADIQLQGPLPPQSPCSNSRRRKLWACPLQKILHIFPVGWAEMSLKGQISFASLSEANAPGLSNLESYTDSWRFHGGVVQLCICLKLWTRHERILLHSCYIEAVLLLISFGEALRWSWGKRYAVQCQTCLYTSIYYKHHLFSSKSWGYGEAKDMSNR